MTDQQTIEHFRAAAASMRPARFTAAEEALADDALLALWKLRDLLVQRDANSLACRVDDVMGRLESLARQAVQS